MVAWETPANSLLSTKKMKTKPNGCEALILELILCLFVVVAIPELFWAFAFWIITLGLNLWLTILFAIAIAAVAIPLNLAWMFRPGAEIDGKRVFKLELSWLPVVPFTSVLSTYLGGTENVSWVVASLVIGVMLFILQAVLAWRQVRARTVLPAHAATKESDGKAQSRNDNSCPI